MKSIVPKGWYKNHHKFAQTHTSTQHSNGYLFEIIHQSDLQATTLTALQPETAITGGNQGQII